MATQPVLASRPALRERAAEARPPEAIDPDGELVARWQSGDEGAFETLVRRHEGRVYRIVLRMLGEREEAEDAAQETFLSLHRNRARFRGEARFSTYVYRVAVNSALNRRRTLGRRRAQLERAADCHAIGQGLIHAPRDPDESFERRQVRARVQRELLALRPKLRAALILYDVEGLGCAEIARVLGVAEGTVKSRLHRARRALHDRLRDLVDPEDAER